jgi:hypothetical protein
MKKISKFGLMLGVTLLTMNLYAGTLDFTLDVKKEQGKMVTFALNKMDKVDLSIYDAEGKMIHSEKVDSQKNINRTYDLRALPEGSYFLEAESDTKISRYEISVVGATASLSANPILEVYKPTFTNKEGLVRVSFLNMDKSPVNIKVYDRANNEVYDSDVIMDQDVKKVFNINEVNDEEYTFVMTYKDRSYTKTFASN